MWSSSGKRPEEPLRMPFVDVSSDDDEFISMREMKKRIVVLEQDSIHKDARIIQIEDTIVQKNRQIDQLQGDVSLLFNMVYDLHEKLEKKFGDEFSDPTDTKRRRKAEEDRARDFAKDDADRAAAMEYWGFDHDRHSWWFKRRVGLVEWYKNPAQFQTFTKVDLTILSKSPYVDDKPGGRGILFFERLQREMAREFPSMHTDESILTPVKGIRDPLTNKRMQIVSWPPTDKEKVIPLIIATVKFEAVAKDWSSVVAGVLQISKKGFRGYKDKLERSGDGEGS
ncbi:hypothetical protein Hanom_Chr09g00761951 [Helianthus anomalus]